MKPRTIFFLAVIGVGIVGVSYFATKKTNTRLKVDDRSAVITPRSIALPSTTTDTALPSSSPARTQSEALKEVAATRNMYMAHVSLRAPQVANPDSAPNREVLQTMVAKALQQSAASSAPSSPSAATANK